MVNAQTAAEKDHSWAWLICFGAFVAYFLEAGLVKCLGVLLPALRAEFETRTWVIGLIISLMPGYGTVTCLLGGILRKRFSARLVLMAYGFLAASGIVGASAATSLSILAFCILLTGFLFGAEAVTMAVLPDYFDKHFDTANVIVHFGMSTGVIVMPLLTQFLQDVYGWRGAMLIIGGLYLHPLVSAALIRPINGIKHTRYIHQDERSCVVYEEDDTCNEAKAVRAEQDHTLPNEEPNSNRHGFSSFMKAIAASLDLHLLTNVTVLSQLSLAFANGYFYTGWLIYLVPHSLDSGFEPYEASALATVGGFGNMAGNIVYMLQLKFMTNGHIMYSGVIIASLSLLLDPVFTTIHSYVGLMVLSFATNVGNATINCSIIKILVQNVEPTELVNAMNLLFIGYSAGSVCSGFLTGWLFDRFGNYTASFLCLGFVPILSLIPMASCDILECMKNQRRESARI